MTNFSEHGREIGRLLLGLKDMIFVPLALIIFLTASPTVFSASLGILFIVFGVFLKLSALSSRSQNAGTVCRDGYYALIRHPEYFGTMLILVGLALYVSSFVYFLITLLFIAFYFHYVILFEESELIGEFGEVYENYQTSVPTKILTKKMPTSFSIPENIGSAIRADRYFLIGLGVVVFILMTLY